MIVLNVGMGQQSSALLIASALELTINGFAFPRLDLAQFSDTGNEMRATYAALKVARAWCDARGVRFDVVRKEETSLWDAQVQRVKGKRSSVGAVPMYTTDEHGHTGKRPKHCSRDWKVRPLERHAKRVANGRHVELWIGYDRDEFIRRGRTMRLPDGWTVRYPLAEAGMTRTDCRDLVYSHWGIDIVSSACVACPFRGIHGHGWGWRWMKERHLEDYAEAVRYDLALRDQRTAGLKAPAYLVRGGIPLEEAVDAAQRQGDLFSYVAPSETCDDGGCWT